VRAFISYSHDSAEHLDRVWDLCERLRNDGIDCRIDQHLFSPPEGWPRWCRDQVQESEFVLVVCTETYKQRYEGKAPAGEGKGAKWEGFIITLELYEAEGRNSKFIPVVFSPQDTQHIPAELRGATRYDLSTPVGYDDLFRHLTDQPARQKSQVGPLRKMPSQPRRGRWQDSDVATWSVPVSPDSSQAGGDQVEKDIDLRTQLGEILSKLLDAHRQGHRSPQATVTNLHSLYQRLSEEDRKRFTELLWDIYCREPLLPPRHAASYRISVPTVILLAFVRFGPINALTPQIFGHVQTLNPKAMEQWARAVCPPFEYAVGQSSSRFSDRALDEIKGFRETLRLLGGEGRGFPLELIEAAERLKKGVECIELERFEHKLGLAGPCEVSPVRPDSINRQRIRDLEELLEIEYEKVNDFQKELAITSSAAAKFELRQRLKREVLPDVRKHEVEYAELLAHSTDLASVPAEQAEATTAELVHALERVQSLPDPNRPEEITRLLTDIRRKLDDPGKVAAAKLKVALPIIPLIASYEMEMDTEAVLINVWRRIKSLFGAKV
jgi:hypothetical protein